MLLSLIAGWIIYQDTLYGRIPNAALIGLVFLCILSVWLFKRPYPSSFKAGLVGISLIGIFLLFPAARTSLGVGDLKLFCIACFFNDLHTLPFFLLISGILGLLWSFIYQKIFHKKAFPLGPALILALVGIIFYRDLYNIKSIHLLFPFSYNIFRL